MCAIWSSVEANSAIAGVVDDASADDANADEASARGAPEALEALGMARCIVQPATTTPATNAAAIGEVRRDIWSLVAEVGATFKNLSGEAPRRQRLESGGRDWPNP